MCYYIPMCSTSNEHLKNSPLLVFLALVSGLLVLGYAYMLGQERFFTVDEYQYCCATHMVSKGKIPYRDFFEHHTPLSYVVHSVFFHDSETKFSEKALRFRKISFGYILFLCLFLFYYFQARFHQVIFSLLGSVLPLTIGVCLFSIIDYRCDNFGAVFLVVSLLLNDLNRDWKSRLSAFLSGLAFAVSILMTQKMILFGAGIFFLFFCYDLHLRFFDSPSAKRYVFGYPYWFLGMFSVFTLFSGACIYAGVFGKMVQIVFLAAAEHEKLYPAVHFSSYIREYLHFTWFSFGCMVFSIIFFYTDKKDQYWITVSLGSVLTLLGIKAQFPYNFVFPSIILGICCTMGLFSLYHHFCRRSFFRQLVFVLIALALIWIQASYTFGRMDNKHQLRLLDKIQKMADADDRFIDNSGGAIFMQPASYYFQHGTAHRIMFDKIFRKVLQQDYIRSAARFMIWDMRYPPYVLPYLMSHYIQIDGDLLIYGKRVQPSEDRNVEFHVLRPGTYFFFSESEKKQLKCSDRPMEIRIDGMAKEVSSEFLSAGRHVISLPELEENFYISSFPVGCFRKEIKYTPHAKLFE